MEKSNLFANALSSEKDWSGLRKYLIGIALTVICLPVLSYEYPTTFKITGLDAASEGNGFYRVYGMPAMTSCPNDSSFAYVDQNDSGASAKIATLMTAYAANKNVNLTIELGPDPTGTNKFCHIVEINILN